MHLVERADGIGEVLERGVARDEVERPVVERHRRRVAVQEVDANALALGVLARDANEGLADVEPGHAKVAALGERRREITRTWRDLEDARAAWKPSEERGRGGAV